MARTSDSCVAFLSRDCRNSFDEPGVTARHTTCKGGSGFNKVFTCHPAFSESLKYLLVPACHYPLSPPYQAMPTFLSQIQFLPRFSSWLNLVFFVSLAVLSFLLAAKAIPVSSLLHCIIRLQPALSCFLTHKRKFQDSHPFLFVQYARDFLLHHVSSKCRGIVVMLYVFHSSFPIWRFSLIPELLHAEDFMRFFPHLL